MTLELTGYSATALLVKLRGANLIFVCLVVQTNPIIEDIEK